jgi:hypothetical protein|tara:strand:- start:5984 stop:6223 length:240 start_codon:yes stop_codon:yes gene_type:complete
MSGHNIVSQLTESAAAVSGLDLAAPLLLVGNGAPNNSGANRHDAYLYLRLDGTAKSEVLYVNYSAGGTASNWTGLSDEG